MTASVILFALAILASAFLIFLVQPMVGKHILPWFGGVPGVWTICLAFFQTTLFLGYAYAHVLIGRVRPWVQLLTHAVLFAVALAMLPVLPGESWRPTPVSNPSLHILAMLAASVGLPFLLLASTGPLVQAWFARAFPLRSPYPLYALSNAGSLAALLSYPFLIEPRWPLSISSRAWSWAFAVCALSVLLCAWLAARARPLEETAPGHDRLGARGWKPGLPLTVAWMLLPACAVILLMGVTNELCLDVASVPFLWVLPLGIYLLTFILCFGSPGIYVRVVWAIAAAISLLLVVWSRTGRVGPVSWAPGVAPIPEQVALYCLMLFSWCMLAHGELYRLRPPPARLTAYYLYVSAGGALGGLFVGLAAPRLFSDYYELPLGLLFSWLLFLAASWRDRSSPSALARWTGVAAVSVGIAGILVSGTRPSGTGVQLQRRNFFGVFRVSEVEPENPARRRLVLRQGTTLHGLQYRDPKLRSEPTAYYGRVTGIGFVMEQRAAEAPSRVGVIGLGVGTLAAYGRPGDRFHFYEIDPDVIRIANDQAYFHYLADSPAEIEVVPGDARLSLESQLRQERPQDFDLLVVDAFTSDAIPIHLLTIEAFRLYQQHLAPGGVLAVHVSNSNFELRPLVLRLGAEVGMHGIEISNESLPRLRVLRSRWVILSPQRGYLDALASTVRSRRTLMNIPPRAVRLHRPLESLPGGGPLWTDDYSDLLRILKGVGRKSFLFR